MIVYISGKMCGLEDYGKANFAYAEELLRVNGHIVLNPAYLPHNIKPEKYMRICFDLIDAADAIYMLDNWTESEDAKTEHDYAEMQGKKIYSSGNLEELLPKYEVYIKSEGYN